MNWGLMHKYLRAGLLRVLQETQGEYSQIATDDLVKGYRTSEGDKIFLLRDLSKGLQLGGSQGLKITEYSSVIVYLTQDDRFFEELVSVAKSMIIFENKDLIVLNKLCNVSSQSGKETKANIPHLLNTWLYSENQSVKTKSTALLVHRLDKGTSGAMLVAKNLETARFIVKQFAQHRITKIYFGLCVGIPRSSTNPKHLNLSGKITTNLNWNPLLLRNEVVSGELNDKMATTYFEVVAIGRIDEKGFKYIGGQEFEDFKTRYRAGHHEGRLISSRLPWRGICLLCQVPDRVRQEAPN